MPGDAIRDSDPFLLPLVREHRSADAVAHRPDALDARATLVVHLDEAALIELNARLRSEQVLRKRTAPDRNDELVDGERLFALGIGVLHFDAIGAGRRAGDFGAKTDIKPLLLEVPERFLCKLLI